MTDSLVTTEKRPLPNIVKIFMFQLGLSIISCALFSMYSLFLLFTSSRYYYNNTTTTVIIIGLLFMLFILVWSISVFHGLYNRSPHAVKSAITYLQATFWLIVSSIALFAIFSISSLTNSRFYMPYDGIPIILNTIYSIIIQLAILWAFVLYFKNSVAVKTAFNLQEPDTPAPQAGLPISVGLLKLFSVIFILTTSVFLAVHLIDNYINHSFLDITGSITGEIATYLTMFILALSTFFLIILFKELKSKSSQYAIFFWLFAFLLSTFFFYLPSVISPNIYLLLSNLPIISNLYGLMIITLWWYFANDPEAKTWFNKDSDLQSNQWNICIVRKIIEKMHSGVLPGFVLIFFIWSLQYLMPRTFYTIKYCILEQQPETLLYSYGIISLVALTVLVWTISIFAAWKQKKYTPLLCMGLLILLAVTTLIPNLSLNRFLQYDIKILFAITVWFIYFLSSKKVKQAFYQREIPAELLNKNKAELPILCFRILCLYAFVWSFVPFIAKYMLDILIDDHGFMRNPFNDSLMIETATTVLVWAILPLINLYLSYKAKSVKTVYIWIFIWIVSLILSIIQIDPYGSYYYFYSRIQNLSYNTLFPATVAFCYFYSSKKAKEYYLKLNK